MKALALLLYLPLCALPANGSTPSHVRLQIALVDGSLIHARPCKEALQFTPKIAAGLMLLQWSQIRQLAQDSKTANVTASFTNGDQLSGRWANASLPFLTSFGRIDVPCERIVRIGQIPSPPKRVNLALGKPVFGKDGASHGKGLAAHVTDGDYDTHAKPPASHFSYRIDLCDGALTACSIDTLKIHWREFGDRFQGIRSTDGEGWASAAWPGEYVSSYQIEYRQLGSENWLPLHQWTGRPADEKAEKLTVEKTPSERPGCSSEVSTTIHGLSLTDVTEIRISAKGGHWIGLYEVEVFGQ